MKPIGKFFHGDWIFGKVADIAAHARIHERDVIGYGLASSATPTLFYRFGESEKPSVMKYISINTFYDTCGITKTV